MACDVSSYLEAMSDSGSEEEVVKRPPKRLKQMQDEACCGQAQAPEPPPLPAFKGPAHEMWVAKVLAILKIEAVKAKMRRPLHVQTACSGTGAPCLALQVTCLADSSLVVSISP